MTEVNYKREYIRPSKRIVNWLTAGPQSLMGIVQWVPAFFIAKYIILYIESSSGKVVI